MRPDFRRLAFRALGRGFAELAAGADAAHARRPVASALHHAAARLFFAAAGAAARLATPLPSAPPTPPPTRPDRMMWN